MQITPLLNNPLTGDPFDGLHTRALTQRLLQGCGWFALCAGGLLGFAASWVSQGPLASQPQWADVIFSQVLMGRLPTFLVAVFVLFRLNFHWVTQPQFVQAILQNERSPWGFALASALTASLCWVWILLSGIGLTWFFLELRSGGHAHVAFLHLLTQISPLAWLHDGLRLWVLSISVAWVSFIDVRFLGAHQLEPSMALSRATVLGLITVGGIEAADFFLFNY